MTFRGLCCSVFLHCDTFSFCIQPFSLHVSKQSCDECKCVKGSDTVLTHLLHLETEWLLIHTYMCEKDVTFSSVSVYWWAVSDGCCFSDLVFSSSYVCVCVLCLSVTSICTLFIGNQSPFLSLAFSTSLSWSPLSTLISVNIYFFITVLSNCLPKDLPHLDFWCCS